jgi:hypothetical protein
MHMDAVRARRQALDRHAHHDTAIRALGQVALPTDSPTAVLNSALACGGGP